ncbi:Threonylcarbamoyl-AMP synthase [Rubripirellula tenax]|uniref:Threonylcarbamoyl-AMP synthase n=1 Tax=Rubripirellula tenax TaxID=2528015 RepID=A0A5C6EI88_9BACT|nr:L-threonylcarbamoyladenylate synthase [Rubripirellula tenax]TWU47361.1 Threonylcarbamoyl-AMP synthase [Rubripirellula tenax]
MVPIRATILPANDDSLDRACELLSSGELVAIPTETVYGLAANAWDADAVAKIFLAKGRPSSNPLIVHVASADEIGRAVRMPLSRPLQKQLDSLVDLWPGPFTVVLPVNERIPSLVTAGRNTVAVRVPSHPVASALLRRCPFPIAAPSANKSKYVSPTTADHCVSGLGDDVALVLDGGPCDLGLESTILLLDERGPRLLRPGTICAEDLASRLKVEVSDLIVVDNDKSESDPSFISPGTMREHYSPRTPLRLIGDDEVNSVVPPGTGRIAFRALTSEIASRYERVETLSQNGVLAEVSHNLFAALRRLDQSGLQVILIDQCEPVGLGRAIMDRIHRAAAGHCEGDTSEH